jgi:hypothetical protein
VPVTTEGPIVNAPLALIDRLLAALFCRTTVPLRPETTPPIV